MTAAVKKPPLPAVAVERFRLLGREGRLRVARGMSVAPEYYEAVIAMLEAENAALRRRLRIEEARPRVPPGQVAQEAARRVAMAKRPSGKDIVCAVARYAGVGVEDIAGAGRQRDVVAVRQVACWLVHGLRPDLSLPRIGALVGGRDHSTVLHAVRQVERREELRRLAVEIAEAEGWIEMLMEGMDERARAAS